MNAFFILGIIVSGVACALQLSRGRRVSAGFWTLALLGCAIGFVAVTASSNQQMTTTQTASSAPEKASETATAEAESTYVPEKTAASTPEPTAKPTPDISDEVIAIARQKYASVIKTLLNSYNASNMGPKATHFKWSAEPEDDGLWAVEVRITGDDPVEGYQTFTFDVNPKTKRAEQSGGPDLSPFLNQ